MQGRDITDIRIICRTLTTTTLTAPAVFRAGQNATVQIAVKAAGSVPLDGNVTVTDADSSALCATPVNGDGSAACQLTLSPGYHHLTATYQPNGYFVGSQSAPVTVIARRRSPGDRCYVNQAATGANNGNSWADAYIDLQDALINYCSETWVAKGTYKPTSTKDTTVSFKVLPGMALYGGFAGNETTRDARDPAANVTTLSGDLYSRGVNLGENSAHVVIVGRAGLNIGAPGPDTVVDGFTITRGYSPDNGAGLLCEGASRLSNLIVTGNHADGYGGGLYGGSPTLTHVTFNGNGAGYSGGAIAGSEANVSYATFRLNSAGVSGGAIYNKKTSPVLAHVLFRDNVALQAGGAIYNDGSSNPYVPGNPGNPGDIVLIFYTDHSGGNASPLLNNVSFVGNEAQDGGAIYNMGDRVPPNGFAINSSAIETAIGTSSPVLTNVTFRGNHAANCGGAMVNDAGFGTSSPTLINVTFNGNNADNAACGGAIRNNIENATLLYAIALVVPIFYPASGVNNPSATNVIIWGNSTPQVSSTHSRRDKSHLNVEDRLAQPISDHSIVQGSHGSGGNWDANLGIDGGGNLDADPKLGVLKDNGGYTPTMLPASGSAAIDAGNDAKCPPIDQRGYTRPFGPHCDIGAVEAGAAPPVNTIATTTTLLAPPTTSVGTAITASVTVAAASGTAKPTGSVTISGDGGSPSCSFNLNNGAGSCTLTFASTGNRILTASYAGGSGFAASNGTAAVQVGAISPVSYLIGTTVNPAGGGTLNCVPNPVVSGGSSTCTAAANVGYVFAGFAGDCSGGTPTCTLSNVTANKAVIANFSVNASAKPVPTPMLDRWTMLLLATALCGFARRARCDI